jgi:hypothetical protein
MVAIFYWGLLALMIIIGGVVIYGIVSIIKNRKRAEPTALGNIIKQLVGVISSRIVCYILFLIVGITAVRFKI